MLQAFQNNAGLWGSIIWLSTTSNGSLVHKPAVEAELQLRNPTKCCWKSFSAGERETGVYLYLAKMLLKGLDLL